MDWDDLERRIADEDWAGALAVALGGWRRRRDPSFADVVDAVAARLPAATTETRRLPRQQRRTFHERWVERARTTDAAGLGPLLATLTRTIPGEERIAVWTERLEALRHAADDPRVAATLFQFLRRAPWSGGPSRLDIVPIYAPVIEMLANIADERLLNAMRELDETTSASRDVRQYFVQALPPAIEAIASASAARRPLEAAERARAATVLDRLLRPLAAPSAKVKGTASGERDEAALLELVLASPDDDAPREVLADHWLEQGDPRGELVNLGLRIARSNDARSEDAAARCDALLRRHEKTWLGTVARVTKRRVFWRGFLTEIELADSDAAEGVTWLSATREPCLATVQAVHAGLANEGLYRRFVMSPALRSLRGLHVTSSAMLDEVLGRRDAWPIEHLMLGFAADARVLDLVASSRVLPRMTKLTLGVADGAIGEAVDLAAGFLERRPLASIGAAPRSPQSMHRFAEWLEASQGALRKAGAVELTDPNDRRRTRLLARGGHAGGMRVDIVCTHLTFARHVIPHLHGMESLHLRWPDDVPLHGPANADLPNELVNTHGLRHVEIDDRWKAFLARQRS